MSETPIQRRTARADYAPATHAFLVEKARCWLSSPTGGGCPVVVTELATSGEEPDAIGWRGGWSIIVECKSSREDFRRDAQKHFRRSSDRGIGGQRYLLVPVGLIEASEIPEGWGLLVLSGRTVQLVKKPPLHEAINWRHVMEILSSTLRRVGHACPSGVNIRCYPLRKVPEHGMATRATLTTVGES
ncbi:MAG: hypothetical protein PHE83_15005 [Opitutaceae bacterium]|nr:hypothetical protein [Opitutaceae bacterium]